jgi:hypothetical protein
MKGLPFVVTYGGLHVCGIESSCCLRLFLASGDRNTTARLATRLLISDPVALAKLPAEN